MDDISPLYYLKQKVQSASKVAKLSEFEMNQLDRLQPYDTLLFQHANNALDKYIHFLFGNISTELELHEAHSHYPHVPLAFTKALRNFREKLHILEIECNKQRIDANETVRDQGHVDVGGVGREAKFEKKKSLFQLCETLKLDNKDVIRLGDGLGSN
jgi:hypothetical protein